MSAPVSSYRAKVYRADMGTDSHDPWCASFPWWPEDGYLRSSDGFHRTYLPTRDAAMRFVDWRLLNDRARLREWAEHYRYLPVLAALSDVTP